MKRTRLLVAVLSALIVAGAGMLFPTMAQAQVAGTHSASKASGVVVDESGEAVPGAYVLQVGTRNGVMTDDQGRFTLSGLSQGAQIRVSYLGYETQVVRWQGENLRVEMKPNDNSLNAAVVTAMGIVRKERSLTYSTQQVKANELMLVPDANVANTLEGKVSGITVTANAGGAGGASKIIPIPAPARAGRCRP